MTTRNDYEALSTDEATQRLSAFYQDQVTTLQDPDKGLLRTAFTLLTLTRAENIPVLLEVTLAKNGIKAEDWKDRPVPALQEIVTATAARGSNAADGLKQYLQFAETCKTLVQSREHAAEPPLAAGPFSDIHDQYEFVKAKLLVISNTP